MPEEKKSRYTPAQKRAAEKYFEEKIETIAVRVPKGRKDYYKSAAASVGLSLNQFAVNAMDEKIERTAGEGGRS